MPSWGRPPRGLDARGRREWKRQTREWDQQSRFQELESDYEDEDEDPDRLYFTGYDVGSGRQGMQEPEYDDLGYGSEDGDEYEYGEDQWQLAQREKEEELAERALRRIRRAKLRGESKVDLSREELDALERRESRQALVHSGQPRPPPVAIPADPSLNRKRSSRQGIFSRAPAPRLKSDKRISIPVTQGRAGSPQTSPGSRRSSPKTSRSSSRQAAATTSTSYDPHQNLQHSFRTSSSSSSLRRRDASPARSLPDDPDWVLPTGRLRSSSSAQLRSDPFAYQTAPVPSGRRNVSGPASAGVAYSSVRRTVPSSTVGGGRVVGDERLVGPSSLGKEVIEISSDEDEKEGESGSDEGVRVDVAEGFGAPATAAGSGRGGGSVRGRGRRGRR